MNQKIKRLLTSIKKNEKSCEGHSDIGLCQNDLETFESHVRKEAIAFELELIDIGDSFHAEGYSRKQLRIYLDDLSRLASPSIALKANFKEMNSICLKENQEPNAVPNYLRNLMGLNKDEASKFLMGEGANPFWKVEGHLSFDEESKDISLVSSDTCVLPATIPKLTMKSFDKLSFCEGYPYCLGTFWIEILLSEKEFFIEPSVEIKGFEFDVMSLEQLLNLKVDAVVAREKTEFVKLKELKNVVRQNGPTPSLDDRTLPELAVVTPDKIKSSVATFFSNETPSDQDLYNLAYALVAYSFTPLTLPSDYADRHGASGGGIVAGLRNLTASMDNIAERRRALSRLEDKFRPQKQLAREKGLQIWHNLASRYHDQAVIGLAWYYGKVEQYNEAYFYRRIASIRGSEASAYWADKYSEKLTSVRVVELEKEIKGAANKTYSQKPEALLLKDLAKTLNSIEALD